MVPITELAGRYQLEELIAGGGMGAVWGAAAPAAPLPAAHTAGVLHRDVKPGNLLLAGDGRVKVTDFGIAQSSGSGHLTRTGALVGTMGYLAPERVSGRSA